MTIDSLFSFVCHLPPPRMQQQQLTVLCIDIGPSWSHRCNQRPTSTVYGLPCLVDITCKLLLVNNNERSSGQHQIHCAVQWAEKEVNIAKESAKTTASSWSAHVVDASYPAGAPISKSNRGSSSCACDRFDCHRSMIGNEAPYSSSSQLSTVGKLDRVHSRRRQLAVH